MSIFKRGYGAVNGELERREKAREQRKGKLWRFSVKPGEEDVPIRFLTEEPVCYFEHTLQEGGRFVNIPCEGPGCEHCAEKKPQFVAAWLVVDKRPFKVKVRDANGKETGEEKVVKESIKMLVRGMTDAGELQRKSKKFGLTRRDYFVTRTGTGTATKWSFDHGEDTGELTDKQLDNYMSMLPESLRGMSLMDIVEAQITGDFPEVNKASVSSKVSSGVTSVEEEEYDEPAKPKMPPRARLGSAKRS